MESGEDDADLFRRMMNAEGVKQTHFKKKLETTRNPTGSNKKPTLSKSKPSINSDKDFYAINAEKSETPSIAILGREIDQTEDGHQVLFARHSISKAQFRNLKRGQYEIEESIDLHGMRQHEAKRALEFFLTECLNLKIQYVIVVHGKGQNSEQKGGVLKPLTIHWLKQQTAVIAFASAPPQLGGTGATCIILKNNH